MNDLDDYFRKLYNRMINEISEDWKKKSDESYKILRRSYKVISKRLERQNDAVTLWIDKYNALATAFNVERSTRETFILKLQTKIEKLKDKEEVK